MKLQFKEQRFQVQAVEAVVDCFAGQALRTNRFTLERSRELMRKAKLASQGMSTLEFESDVLEDIGYRNSPIQLTDSQVLTNIREVQERNDLHLSQSIERP